MLLWILPWGFPGLLVVPKVGKKQETNLESSFIISKLYICLQISVKDGLRSTWLLRIIKVSVPNSGHFVFSALYLHHASEFVQP